MVERTIPIIEADHKVMIILACPGEPGERYKHSVSTNADRVVEFANRFKFDTIVDLRDQVATPDAVNNFLHVQSLACMEHRAKNSAGKFLLFVYYTGRGSLIAGNIQVSLTNP